MTNTIVQQPKQVSLLQRKKAVLICLCCVFFFVALYIAGAMMGDTGLRTDFLHRNLPPSLDYPFGTDWLGRDLLTRTVKGLCISIQIGMLAAMCSAVLAGLLGVAAATFGGKVDTVITGMIDVVMSTPHLVMLILISFAMGGGVQGVVVAVALTHWTRLARILRAEVMQLKNADYLQLSTRLGKSKLWIARNHILPHLLPQFVIGLILLFPHAILHSAGLSFLGFGLTPHNPSIGILLSESMQQLSTGHWWLAVIPGVCLICMVKVFDILGNTLRYLSDPQTSQQ